MLQTQPTTGFRRRLTLLDRAAKTPTQLYFVSPEVFTAEQTGIFATQWVLVGHQNLATYRPASYR